MTRDSAIVGTRTLRIVRWAALALIVLIVLIATGIAFVEFGPDGNPQGLTSANDFAADTVTVPKAFLSVVHSC